MNYPKTVLEIHNEFERAGDQILNAAKRILKQQSKANHAKGELLKKLGFTNTAEAKKIDEATKQVAKAKEDAKLVRYYNNKYPLNKFITDDAVKKICEKYSLVLGDVSRYTGFVPQNKLEAIAAFKCDKKDKAIAQDFRLDSLFSHYLEYMRDRDGFRVTKSDTEVPLKICAPLKDMDMNGHKVKGHKVVKHVPDPVVLQPVKGGYLILAAWGDEASDELVLNPKHN